MNSCGISHCSFILLSVLGFLPKRKSALFFLPLCYFLKGLSDAKNDVEINQKVIQAKNAKRKQNEEIFVVL